MKLAFMSSVYPKLALAELAQKANDYGYAGLEFRPQWEHAHGVEIESSKAARAEIKMIMADSGIDACSVSPGCKFCSLDEAERDANFETLAKFIELAHDTGISRIRVFGDPLPRAGRGDRAASYGYQAEYLARSASAARDAGITLCLETHSNFRALDAAEVLYRAAYPSGLRINWHLAHCLNHGEGVDEAYRHVKGLVRHVHFSVEEGETADDSIHRQAELLLAEGYEDYFAVEVINPDDGDDVMKRHAAAWKSLKEKLGF